MLVILLVHCFLGLSEAALTAGEKNACQSFQPIFRELGRPCNEDNWSSLGEYVKSEDGNVVYMYARALTTSNVMSKLPRVKTGTVFLDYGFALQHRFLRVLDVEHPVKIRSDGEKLFYALSKLQVLCVLHMARSLLVLAK